MADSLKSLLENRDTNHLTIEQKIDVLSQLAALVTAPNEILDYGNQLKSIISNGDQTHLILAHQFIGVAHRMKGDLKRSLENLILSTEKAIEQNEYHYQIQGYLEIANTYTANQDHNNALSYELKAIEIGRIYGDSIDLGINLLNTGFSYYSLEKHDSAILLYNEAEPIFTQAGLPIGNAYVTGNRALVYWKQGKTKEAIQDLFEAIALLEPLGDDYAISDYHIQLGKIFHEQNEVQKAIDHTENGINLAKELDLKESISDGALLLSELYQELKQFEKALQYHQEYLSCRDSVENTEQTKTMANMRTEFEVNLREKEISLLEQQQELQWTYIIIAIIMFVAAFIFLLYFRQRYHNSRLLREAEQKLHDDDIYKLLASRETQALQSMVNGRDQERIRISQELHNHFGSLFASIKMNLNGIKHKSPREETIVQLVDQACTDIRSLSHSLNMGISEGFGLIPALKDLVVHLSNSGEMQVEFSEAMNGVQLDSEGEIFVYRIIQELVGNALKHAKASELSISVTHFDEEQLVNVLVEDNGDGFDPSTLDPNKTGMGLRTLEEMVENYQGEISIDSNALRGTTISVDLPLDSLRKSTEL
ncbi:MAG: ATP-binding protein [Cytophagales bacterium]|nr:ATP-binding protein [Cytophagales bacterium]